MILKNFLGRDWSIAFSEYASKLHLPWLLGTYVWHNTGTHSAQGAKYNHCHGCCWHFHRWQCFEHRHISNIDCLAAHTACLVCFISTVNGRSEKKKPIKTGASSRHITNLRQSILETFDIYGSEHRFERITRCELTKIFESAILRNSLDKFGPMQPIYRFLIVIHLNAMLLFYVYIIDLKEYSFHFYYLY